MTGPLTVEFAPTIPAADHAELRKVVRFMADHLLVVHGRTVMQVGEVELHVAGEGPRVDGRPGRIHKRVALIGDNAYNLTVNDGAWLVS